MTTYDVAGSQQRSDMADRYDTDAYPGAVGLNWYTCDPTLEFVLGQHMRSQDLDWARPRLEAYGELCGGPVARRAEETDRNPPRLERYDRWGHDVGQVVMPASFQANRQQLVEQSFSNTAVRTEAAAAGVDLRLPGAAAGYLLNQAEIGMTCALGTGGEMVYRMAERYAPADVRVMLDEIAGPGGLMGETAQSFTERSGGSDLGALETTATPYGDVWLLNGVKWFVSNANGGAWVVLARPEGAAGGVRGVASFLVLRQRRDGTPNGVHIRRLKDKLGTKAVASAEVELVDAEAFLLSDPPVEGERNTGDGHGLGRLMQLTNAARLGVAMMGLGCARRSLVEALCYARSRAAFGARLIDQPLMRRTLTELLVEVEAAQALVFDAHARTLRLTPALAKLRAARLGITAASTAVEVHGGNGYCETWPVARILRDAQVNTVWEGGDNILCLDVRRAMTRESAHEPFLAHIREAAASGPSNDATTALVERRITDLDNAINAWQRLPADIAEARLFPLAQLMIDVLTGALLVEQAGHEQRSAGTDRKSIVAQIWCAEHLADRDALRGIADPGDGLSRFDDLVEGALLDSRS
ncbi:MAG TPA: acyl-CoA dehydrogenase family protein [Mycobacteriales bacterium]|nr:acyl-CoA dehydrogenase family protein [Mycobacteriales bacterium]